MRTKIIIILFALFFNQASLLLAQDNVIQVGIFQNKPLSFTDANGVAQGIYPDVIREIAKMNNWKLKFSLASWSENLEALEKGQIDLMVSIVYSKERDKIFDFSKEPVVTAWGQVYTEENSKILNILDLNGKRVAIMEKDINGKNFVQLCRKFHVNANFVNAKTYDDVCGLILSQKADAGVINNINGEFLKRKYRVFSTPIMFDPVNAVFASQEKKNHYLLNTIDSQLAEWRHNRSSEYYQIMANYFGETKGGAFPYKLIVIIISIAAGISLFLFIWMRILKNQVAVRTKALSESEEKYRLLFSSSNDAVFVHQPSADGTLNTFIEINDVACKMYGYSREEFLKLSPLDLAASDRKANVKDQVKRTIKDRSNIFEIIHKGKNNNEFPVEVSAYLFDFKGKTTVLSIVRNITSRKRVEKALQDSEKKYRKLIRNISDVIVIMDKDGLNKYKSPNIEEQFGWHPDELVGQSGFSTVHPDDQERLKKEFSKLINGEKLKIRTEYRYLCKDGSFKPVELTAVNLIDDPLINGILANYKDISDRKRSEEILKQSEEKYRTMIERSNDMIWTLDREGNFTFFNEQTEKVTGLQLDEWIGKSFSPLVLEEDLAQINEVFQKSIKGESAQYELRIKNMDGDILTIAVNTAPINKNGSAQGIVSFGRDISEQRRLENQIQQTQRMESIGTLAGGIAHDFNNILFPILGHSEMLLDDIPDDSTTKESVKEIYKGSLRAKELVQQILTFSRQERNEMKLMKIQPVLKEALKMLRSTIPVTINIQQEIESECGPIKADPTQIHQIIMNLATNAFHAMEDSGGAMSIILKEKQLGKWDLFSPNLKPGRYACLTVRDTGAGMSEDITTKIFDPFFTTKEKGKGTGMGLSVVHGIVNRMGGAIQLYSKPGEGTEFNIYFLTESMTFTDQSVPHQSPVQGGNEKILLVDDEKGIIAMEKQMLKRLGYEVSSRASSLEALEIFRNKPDSFDLVITDLSMPNMPGDKLASELLKIKSDVRIILCTGFSEKITPESAKEIGIKEVLLKPVVMKDLAQKIRKVLDENGSPG